MLKEGVLLPLHFKSEGDFGDSLRFLRHAAMCVTSVTT
jgi:hypothetical protein